MSKERAIANKTMLDIAEGELRVQQEYEDSTIGKVGFALPAIFMGAQMGGQAQKTMEDTGVVDFFKQRKQAKKDFANNPELQKLHGGSDNKAFRNYFKSTTLKARALARGTERGDDILVGDMKGEEAVNSVVKSVEQMEGFTNGSSTVAVNNNNPGNIQYFKGIEDKYKGATKGDSYKDGQGVTRFHVKFDTVDNGRAALKDVVSRKWSESNQDINTFVKNYTGLGPSEELSNYVGQVKRDLEFNKPSTNLGMRSGKNLVDKNKIRAFYLNAITDNQFNPETGKVDQVNKGFNTGAVRANPTTNVSNLNNEFTAMPGVNLMDYGINNGDYQQIGVDQLPLKVRFPGDKLSGLPIINGGEYNSKEYFDNFDGDQDVAAGFLNTIFNTGRYGFQNLLGVYNKYRESDSSGNIDKNSAIMSRF